MRVEDGRGQEFRQVRELAGVTIRQVAADADIHHTTVSRWERGERDISQATYDRLVSVLAAIIDQRASMTVP
jgi:transcriptional regulator with XRE-family HTH domain